jgi:hypothetical protein
MLQNNRERLFGGLIEEPVGSRSFTERNAV